MKNLRTSRVLAVLLTIIMAMTSMSFATDDIGDSSHAYKAKFMSSWDNSKTGELTYYFLESYFNKDPESYNSHLATASMALAMAGSTKGDQFVKSALTDLGCIDYASQDYGDSSDNSVGVAVAMRKLANGKTLVPVVIRGAGYENEWAQNFIAGSSGNAEGFEAPAVKVEQFVNTQIGNTENVVIWITGYSRGGSIANLAAKKLSDKYGKDKVFAYCFDAPMSASPADTTYKNIHLVKNAYDGITLVLPEYMGFGSNGSLDKELGPNDEKAMVTKLKTFSDDASKFTSPSSLKWNKFSILVDLGSSNLLSDVVKLYLSGGEFYENKIGKATTPAEVWNELLKRLQVAIPTRSAYADTDIQSGFVALAKLINSMTDEQKAGVKEDLLNTSTLVSWVNNKTLVKALACVQSGDELDLSDSEYADIAAFIYKSLFDKSKYTDEQKTYANQALSGLIKPLLVVLREDFNAENQILGTILQSGTLDTLGQCHYLEVNMAWLMTEDSYYNGEIPAEDEEDVVKVATTKITKLTADKKAFTVKWTKKTSKCSGYEIQYSTKSNFKSGVKTIRITSKKTTSKKIKNLKAKKKYYVRIRCYRTVNGTKVPGKWSSAKKVTTKK